MITMQEIIQSYSGTGMQVANAAEFHQAMDPGLGRPYLAEDGRIYVDRTVGFKPQYDKNNNYVMNSGHVVYNRELEPTLLHDAVRMGLDVTEVTNATVLRKDQWIAIDSRVGMAIRKRLKAYADLRALNSNNLNAYALATLEREIMNDAGEALVTMDGIAEGRSAQSVIGLESIPLPITYSDWWTSKRFLEISRNKGQGIDISRGEQAGRRCGEMVEQTTIGTVTGLAYGTTSAHIHDSKVYGYTNHPGRITVTTLATSATITTNIATTGGQSMLTNVGLLIDAAVAQNFYGPYVLYLSGAYFDLMRNDFKANGDKTIETRVRELSQIADIRRLDYLSGDVMLLIQMDGEYLEAINGMEFTTIQWLTKGEQQVNFKTLGIQLARIKPVYVSNPGSAPTYVAPIVHGTTS